LKDWENDKRWSDRFLPEIKRELGNFLMCEPKQEEDSLRNTDLIVIGFDSVRIACRIRKHKYLSEYGDQFTIRAGRASGNKTELTKIVEGWGDYLFYGFCDEHENKLFHWKIIDLKVFRLWFNRQIVRNQGVPPGDYKPNKDGKSKLAGFDVREMPPEAVAKEYTVQTVKLRAVN